MDATISNQVAAQFKALLTESSQKYARLRELPPYGRKHIELHFHEAFNIYSKLWAYQQKYRSHLTEAGLKRWEIGEVASKIGQLYYTYYLRTSEIHFLAEAFTFYNAIYTREYFRDSLDSTPLVIKLLRFYARFILVCILLSRQQMVVQLHSELRSMIEDYMHMLQAQEAREWRLVLREIQSFQHANELLPTMEDPYGAIAFRLSPNLVSGPQPAAFSTEPLHLQEAVITSYYTDQVKFSELPLDAFRMMQALEFDSLNGTSTRVSGLEGTDSPTHVLGESLEDDTVVPANPQKYLVYRPGARELLAVLATACEGLQDRAVLLLYLSANGTSAPGPPPPERSPRGFSDLDQVSGGLQDKVRLASTGAASAVPAAERKGFRDAVFLGTSSAQGKRRQAQSDQYLHVSDLVPLTRKSIFLIVDSDNSAAFGALCGNERGDPAMCLLSPASQPQEFGRPERMGRLFTLFLSSPLIALCYVLGVGHLTRDTFTLLKRTTASIFRKWADALRSTTQTQSPWTRVLDDVFLRQLVMRYLLCKAVFTLHGDYSAVPEYQPQCCPPMPPELAPDSGIILQGIQQISVVVGKRHLFKVAYDSS
ncbi:hypothetical protein CYMTET_55906 [Cymbomonas tetramitiformis]|uniref:Protein SCAI n=1 Tax=Cymbomonas tetramitiformis TaxID=36881 RepID=A0AAE0BCD4_9CHLO|nr:hypothetical protein CYMTET_55906 [Cymbomonas tetramitiformis]